MKIPPFNKLAHWKQSIDVDHFPQTVDFQQIQTTIHLKNPTIEQKIKTTDSRE